MPLFSTDFAPPAALASLTLFADEEDSAIRLVWSPSALAPEDFGGYRVYRRIGTGDWILLETFSSQASVEYNDYEAPLNTALGYRVTQSNLDFESDPIEASTQLESHVWWIVTPANDLLTFPITRIRSATLSSEKVQDVFHPVGRPGRVVVGDVVLTESGQLSFLVMPDQPGQVALLKAVQANMDGTMLLKAPDGAVHEVQLGDMTRNFTNIQGLQELSVSFIGAS